MILSANAGLKALILRQDGGTEYATDGPLLSHLKTDLPTLGAQSFDIYPS